MVDQQAIKTAYSSLVLAALRDALDIPAGVPSRAPRHQLGLRHLADALRGGFAPHRKEVIHSPYLY